MGINRQTDLEGELQIGPTSLGLVRIYVSGQNVDLPMDFTPDEAREIAAELLQAADQAAPAGKGKSGQRQDARSDKNRTRPGKSGSRPPTPRQSSDRDRRS